MRYANITIQSLLILAGLISGIASLFSTGGLIVFLIVQFFIGAWQYIGCMINLLSGEATSALKRYCVFASVYLLILFVLYNIGRTQTSAQHSIFFYGFVIPSSSFALYYYYLSVRRIFPRRRRGKFLPHLSF